MKNFVPTHIATLGPYEHPKRIEVEYLRSHDMPEMHVVMDERGKQLTVHRQKLKLLDGIVPAGA